MLVSELVKVGDYPKVQGFIEQVIDMQFNDVRAMLQLPRPEQRIFPACNFAITSVLCNLISGLSTTMYKPKHLHHELNSKCGSGKAFTDLAREFFPPQSNVPADFPEQLYKYARNPLVHSFGLQAAQNPVVSLTRVFDQKHPTDKEVGWDDENLTDMERPGSGYCIAHPTVAFDGQIWTLHCDRFYFDMLTLMRGLTSDSDQMVQAEVRFDQGVYNWRS